VFTARYGLKLNAIQVNLSPQSAHAIHQETVSVDDVMYLWACRRDMPSAAAASVPRTTFSDLRFNSHQLNYVTSTFSLTV